MPLLSDHWCNEKTKPCHGWYFEASSLKLANEPEGE